MSFEFNDIYINGYRIDDPIVNTIHLIAHHIKHNNFDEAKLLMLQHNLSFENIVSRTQLIKTEQLVKFVDYFMEI